MRSDFCKKEKGNITIEFALMVATCVLVAAIFGVIYGVVRNYIKNQYVSRYKDASGILIQAIKSSQADNGKLTSWNYTSAQTQDKFARTYIVPYMNVAKDCRTKKGEGCFEKDTYYKYLNGTKSGAVIDDTEAYKFINREGMSFYIKFIPNCVENMQRCIDIYVDVNGPKRGPSQFGRDLFLFYVYPFTNEIKPFGTYSNDKQAYDSYTNHWARYPYPSDCKRGGWGATCGTKLMIDGFEMNY